MVDTTRNRNIHPDQRFDKKIRMLANGCWEWIAGKTNGYGVLSIRHDLHVKAHRYAFERYRGYIPDGMQLDHLCRNPLCVNPWHLDPVSCKENLRRSPAQPTTKNAAKTHCARGHAFSEENTYKTPIGGRACRECKKLSIQRVKARKTANAT